RILEPSRHTRRREREGAMKRHRWLLLVIGVVGVVGATMLVAIGAPVSGPDAAVGRVVAVRQANDVIAPQSDEGIQIAQVTPASPGPDKDKDKDKGKCPTKPCPKVRHLATN